VTHRLPAGLVVATLVAILAGRVQARRIDESWEAEARTALDARLASVETRQRQLSRELQRLADEAAVLPGASSALRADRAALLRLFGSLEGLAPGGDGESTLAVRTPTGSILAWTGRTSEVRGIPPTVRTSSRVFVLAGSVTTTLVAASPVRGTDGAVVGFATAELPLRVRRNIQNDYLLDFDRLADAADGVEVRYRDIRSDGPSPFPPLPPDGLARDAELRAPDGSLLATVRVSAPAKGAVISRIRDRYRRVASGFLMLAVLAWMIGRDRRRWAVGAVLLRLVPLVLGWPLDPDSRLLSPLVFSSPLYAPLQASPLDLLATALLALFLSTLLLERALAGAPSSPRPGRALPALLFALLLLAGAFAWIADVYDHASLDLDSIALVPRTAVHALIHVALLAVLATGLVLSAALFVLAGPLPDRTVLRVLYVGAFLALVAFALSRWPPEAGRAPPPPAAVLLGLGALAAWTRSRWQPALRAASAEARAGLAVLAVGALALLLFPTLAHFAESALRAEIEHRDATLLVGQAERRASALAATCQAIDRSEILGEVDAGPVPPGVEELAFSVWSSTELAAGGFSSALELQDPRGAVISRFALNLPSLAVAGPPRPLPRTDQWQISRERVTIASAERDVMHARRRLVYHGEIHGAAHVYLAEDFASLPFVPSRDPYSTLFRPAGRGERARNAALLVYDASGRLTFSSAERALALPPDILARARREPRGFWTDLDLDEEPHHAFLFSDSPVLYALAYPRRAPSRHLADHVEAFAGLSLLALAGLLALLLVRTFAGRPTLSFFSLYEAVRRRFTLRLFVAFIAVAVVPVAVLEIVVRRFVADRLHRESEDQARERAAVAKKAVEDFAFFRRGDSPGQEPVTDAALVWAASLIRNDLDVFDRGRLLASSKRELYASGLLLPRAAGSVYRAIVLDGLPTVLRPERIGSFSTLVVSVPVNLGGPEPGLLSIPQGLRQREEEAALEELDRTIRLGTFAFLVVAALLAQSIARRISDPIRDLTRATRRVAEGDLEARVSTESRDELRDLVDSFNQMAGDLHRQRADLERSNRLAAWAEMARQVAHEVKNPLTPIQLSAEHLRRVFGDPAVDFRATLEACTDTILKQVRSLRRIVTEFTAFARPPAPAHEPQDIADIVSQAVAPYRAVLPPGVRLGLDLPPGLPTVQGDRRLLERAVLNLVENALQAVGDKGTIDVRTRAVDGRLEVEVEDSGPGLPADVRDRIFEPFFSTKTGGSGLGLALVKKTAQDHGGGVRLESPAGGRTRAVLWLPAEETPPASERSGDQRPM
jgi:two-component system, NtrC family, nitrogen regulation sensor histidine kinase NtrY